MYDLIIIGSGPAGYVAAIRAAQLGMKTAIIEKDRIGGMCLNWGCIPSKSILESVKLYNKIKKDAARYGVEGIDKDNLSFNWDKAVIRADQNVKKLTQGIEFLLKKNGAEIINASAKIIDKNTVSVENRTITAKNIIIAIGSSSPKIESEIENLVLEPMDIFKARELPDNIIVVGEGPVAIELTQAYNLMGKKVSMVLEKDTFMPLADAYLSNYMQTKLKKDRIKLINNNGDISLKDSYKDGVLRVGEEEVPCELIVNARHRKANPLSSDIEFEMENDYIKVDENFQTSTNGIYAIGDVNGKSHFAHIASAEGLFVVNRLNGVDEKLDLSKFPMNMYSQPEAAQIGHTESQLKEMGVDYKISEFPLSANGKAITENAGEGFIRILSENKYGEVLGVQIIANNATDMINEAAAYMQLESTVYDIAKTVHTHPTISEVFMEAGFEALDQAIHK
ncbi:MAG: dihydrolipoyl dehydrogenase [Bacteroidales bacterium]|nr:dihydrolipoyl dehydrogenase [Bacteroidales bacterium]MDD4685398.1 dihydrolipoyl dehydrogenase [Bacteroidales bacterium]